MENKMTKAQLILEIADKTELSKNKVSDVLKELTQITYREAENGFIVPGICKLSVVRRKARRCRIPSTGQLALIGERNALKVVPLGVAKNAVTPKIPGNIQIIKDEPVSKTPSPSSRSDGRDSADIGEKQQILPGANEAPPSGTGSIVFACQDCGAMVSAPPVSAGEKGECPLCGAETNIPLQDFLSTDANTEDSQPVKGAKVEDFLTFVCQACGQEIEASTSMAGLKASCPTCGTQIGIPKFSMETPSSDDSVLDEDGSSTKSVPVKSSSMTMRIDLSDLE